MVTWYGRQSRRRSTGFSIPELLVVVSIIGLAVAVSIPVISEHVRSAKVRSAANELLTTLRVARMIAVTQRAPVEVALLEDQFLYTDAQGRVRRIFLPPGTRMELAETPTIVVFEPDGSVTGGTELVIVGHVGRGRIERWKLHTNAVDVGRVYHERVDEP